MRAIFGAAFALLWVTLAPVAATADDSDKGVIADFVSKALSSPTSDVSIGAVEGALSSNVTIRDIVISDADGPWLKLDRAKLVWNRLALLQRKLQIDTLEVGTLQVLRKPPPGPPSDAPPGPILPELPLSVIVKAFSVQKIALGAPVLGVAADLDASGAATLGPPSEGLDLTLAARRTDAPGAFDVRLSFVPETSKLTLHAHFDEPAGGLVARLANLPGAPPVTLALDGEGPLDAFAAKLAFSAGADIGANGDLDLARQRGGRHLAAKLRAHIAGLLPPVAAQVFSGETALDVAALLGDDGAVGIEKLALASTRASLDAKGGIDASRVVALDVQARALPGAPNVGAATFEAKLNGPADAVSLDATMSARDAVFGGGKLGALDAAFKVTPNGPYSADSTRIAVDAQAKASGLALDDASLGEAVGTGGDFALKADVTPSGLAKVTASTLRTDRLTAGFVGDVSLNSVRGTANLVAPDLSHFAKIAGLRLTGALDAKADIDGAPRDRVVDATVDARIDRFAVGIGAVDGFAGGVLRLKGGLAKRADGGFGFSDLRLEGAHGSARLDGSAAKDKAAVSAVVDVPSAKEIDPRVAGHLRLTADLTGALAHLGLAAKATLEGGALMGRDTPTLALTANVLDVMGSPQGAITLDGTIGKRPANGGFDFAKIPDGDWRLDNLALAVGSTKIDGGLAFAPDRTIGGRLAVSAPKLDDLSPLTLQKLDGAMDATFNFDAPQGRQSVSIKAKSARLSAPGVDLRGLDVDMLVNDAFGDPSLKGRAGVDRLVVGGETISNLQLTAADGGDLSLAMSARGLAVDARGALDAPSRRLALQRFAATGAGRSIRLSKPAAITWGGGGVGFEKVVLDVDGGRLSIDGRVGEAVDLKISAAALPLSVADLARPGIGLAGTLDASTELKGTPGAPQGPWRVSVKGLSSPQTRGAGLPALTVHGSGALAGGRATLDVAVDGGKAIALRLSGSAPVGAQGALDLKIGGGVDLALANAALAPDGRRASGAAAFDLRVTGAIAQPEAQGTIDLHNGAFSDEASGFTADRIEASLKASGKTIDIARFSAATPNGGALNANGRLTIDPAAGFPGAVHVTGQKVQALSNAVVAATVDLALDVSGALARAPKIGGKIGVVSMDITIPGRLPGQAEPLADIRHIAPGPTARRRIALAKAAKTRAAGSSPFDASLDLKISAPSRIFVRGRGVDAELSGDLTITGSSSRPRTEGGFQLRRGTFSIIGKRLDFSRGQVTFHGEPIPDLDLTAQTSAGDVTAFVNISGPASKPVFAFSSRPALGQDEIISRILFEKPSGGLSPIQALQLANAVASLSGAPDAFERVRKSLGVDSLDIGSDANGGATLGVRRALNSRLSLGVTTGAKPEDNGVSLDLNVTRRLRLQSGVNSAGGSTVGAGFEWEY